LDLHEKQGLDPDLWLSGPDKEREPDVATRLFLVEALLLLCAAGRVARRTLRMNKVQVVMKWADMVEEDEHASERISDCIQYLRRDEDEQEDGTEDEDDQLEQGAEEDDDESSDDCVANAYRNQLTTSVGATSCPVVTTSAKGMTMTTMTNTTTIITGGKQQQQRDGDGEADFDNVD
jgi:hypothetical protein